MFITKSDGESEPKEYISEISVEITEKYVNEMYESCRHVTVPATGGLAMDMACGKYNSKSCTGKRSAFLHQTNLI